jgi:hypothetical protein
MLRFIASRYASWPPAVTTVAGSSAIVTGVAVVATVALHRRDDAQSPTAADIASVAQRCSRTARFPVPGVDVPDERKEIPP